MNNIPLREAVFKEITTVDVSKPFAIPGQMTSFRLVIMLTFASSTAEHQSAESRSLTKCF
jgi:hypothetical protein